MKTLNDYVDEEDARNPGFRQRVDDELAAMNAGQFEFDYVWPEPKSVARMVAVRVERWDALFARIAALEAERDAARAEAGRLRGLLGRARVAVVCLSEWSAPGAQVGVELLAAIDAALAGSGEQRP